MPSFQLAHLREQGQDMLIFPLDQNFHHKSDQAKNDILNELEMRANNAGLAGSAVIVWDHGQHMHFMGPRPWHPFLKSIDMGVVMRNLNQEISWPD